MIKLTKQQVLLMHEQLIKATGGASGVRLTSVMIEFGEEYSTMTTIVVTDTQGTDPDIDKWLEKVKEIKAEKKLLQKKAEKKAAEEKLLEQRTEGQSYTFKGTDMESIMEQFSHKMATLNSAMSSLSGLDLKV